MSLKKILTVSKTAVVLAGILVAGTLITDAHAVESSTANTLRISPVRTDIKANPGETKTVKITVTNPSDFKVSVQPIQNDFVAGDEAGSPALILDENEYAPSHSLKRFLQPLKKFELKPGESKSIDAIMKIPSNAEAGGYFGAIRFAPTDPDGGGQVNMSASLASIILLRVNGDAPEKLTLTDFGVKQDGKLGTFFTNTDKMSVTARFKNDGKTQLAPFGKISITNGGKIVYEEDFNNKEQQDVVLPSSARRWDVALKNIDGFGKYTVNATFTYGDNNQTIEIASEFWVVPLPILIGVGGLILVIIGGIVALVLRKRYGGRKLSMGSRRRK